ncbi:juvenile hormone epoxide hydrolase-like [Anticarsia gemmatalis]|uniref:juvenile hormone epoxide hydrolase-like n=1 Tax=Anticarsia gemmatalis TaxID=129554 RepID=UPI003F77697B
MIFISLFLLYSLVNSGFGNTVSNGDWWGPSSKVTNDSVVPFRVNFREDAIQDLRQRLLNHRPFTPPLEGVGFEYGFNTDALDSWVQYWAQGYDFKAREAFLNQFPQYKTNIQGLDIHFLRVRPQAPSNVEVIPLLFLHGWPGTVRELYDTIPYLTAIDGKRNYALEVIAPSLPGFGFSDAAVRPGLGATEMAVVMRNLMHRLGYNKFYVQGGDWGARVGSDIATLYPEEVLGYHTNFAIAKSPMAFATWLAGAIDPSHVVDPALADRLYPIRNIVAYLMREMGYFHLQATKPDSLGVAMSDSPSGLLAYLLQLVSSGTSKDNYHTRDGGLDKYFSRDSLLDILTINWMTNTFTTSSRIYAESLNLKSYNNKQSAKPTPVPTWSVHAKEEIIYESPVMLKYKYPNLIHSTVFDDGGHFLALEKPKVFAEDVHKAIAAFRRWHEINRIRVEL